LRILNTIKPVTRVFTAMDAAKPVRVKLIVAQKALILRRPFLNVYAPSPASVVARGDKMPVKSSYEMKIDLLTYICDRQHWRNYHDTDIFTPHNPTTVDLWRFRWINGWYRFMPTKIHWAIKSQQPFAITWTVETPNKKPVAL
jgi:hypothetical protein